MRTYTRRKPPAQVIEDVQALCRLCLGKTEEMTPIFGANIDDVFATIPMRIMMCVGLEVTREDIFPKLICQKCNNELNRFYNFKKNCNVTFRKLKANLLSIKKVDKKSRAEESDELKKEKDDKSTILELVNDETCNQREKNIVVEDSSESQESQTSQSDRTPVENSELKGSGEKSDISDNTLDEDDHIVNDKQIQKNEIQKNIRTKECIASYLVNALVERGVLSKHGDKLEVLDQNLKTFHLETAYGSQIVMELVEEEPEVPVAKVSRIRRPKIFETSGQNHTRCGECGVRFASRGGLTRHLRVHSGERPYACRTCGRRFAQREVMRRHELLHAEKRPYQCGACPKAYTQRGSLQAHARSHAPPDARAIALHRCTRCTKVFLYQSGLSRHILQVHQGHRIACAECPRVFRDSSSAQRHARAHRRRAS